MKRKRRSRGYWEATVARWKQSGLSGQEFSDKEGLRLGTLRWWAGVVRHATRAEHGVSAGSPIELVARPTRPDETSPGPVRISVGGVLVGCDVGTDVHYVALLVRALVLQSQAC